MFKLVGLFEKRRNIRKNIFKCQNEHFQKRNYVLQSQGNPLPETNKHFNAVQTHSTNNFTLIYRRIYSRFKL